MYAAFFYNIFYMSCIKYLIFSLVISFACFLPNGSCQNTVGLISHNLDKSYQGYNLFYPHNQSSVFLINNCGELINEWTDNDDFRPGNMVYLTEEGNLIKCKRVFNSNQDSIWAGGGGEIVEMLDWDNNLLWSLEVNDENRRLHHDVAPMKNGNVLMIAWESKSNEDVIAQGRDPESLERGQLWPDFIFEYNPALDSIVWEWHVWDHLIQDFDESKENFGVVADNPQLVDINWHTNLGFPDWMHSNAIDYNEELDEILLCVPHFDEIWIIDHSTTTEEAAGHIGGNGGKGGDLLFRWGNPQTYKIDEPQQIFFAHDAQWADNFRTEDQRYYSGISIFNNRVGDDYSTANIITPKLNDLDGFSYEKSASGTFLPDKPDLTVTHPDTFSLYSNSLSGVQVLPNDNLLICSGRFGRIFEIEPSTNNVVWEYVVPFLQGEPVEQGTVLEFNNNITFRFSRYPLDFKGFEGKDLEPKGYIELNPNEAYCDTLISSVYNDRLLGSITVYPNPIVEGVVHIQSPEALDENLYIYDLLGRQQLKIKLNGKLTKVDLSALTAGIYILGTADRMIEKLVID